MKSLSFCFSLALFTSLTVSSCSSSDSTEKKDSNTSTENSATSAVPQNAQLIEAKTFEVKDSTGKSQGWGYDIYVDGHKNIHQPIIPSIPGNNSFKTESDAKKTGDFAAQKMKLTGSLPTLSIQELDSLGITK